MRQAGDRVDRYVIEAVIGKGGMGEVYEARDTRLGRRVALKLLLAGGGGDATQRMVREARVAAAFEHPNAVVVYDVGDADGVTYLAMELVRGKPMRAYVGDAAVPLERRLRWLVDAARALAAAHRQGIVHRDVKPDNVMIREDGAVKVLDFGIARRSTGIDPSAPTAIETGALHTITAEGVVVGTPLYSAPEQLRSEDMDGRVDQFAWGVTAYELLSGSPPWRTDADGVALIAQILSSEPAPIARKVPGVPDAVAAAVHRALSKRPEDRFESIDLAADAIEPFAAAGVPTGPGVPGRSSIGPPASGEGPGVSRRSAPARIARGTARVLFWIFAGLGALLVAVFAYGAARGNLRIDTGRAPGDAAAELTIDALGCEDARVEGPGAGPELARAIGVGACARLATEVGVEWGAPGATHRLSVAARLAEGGAEVDLAVGERRATARGKTPIDAVVAAVALLQKALAAPPMTAEQIAAWGVADAVAARRLERVWRRMVLNVSPDDEAEIKRVLQSDPESPWPHVFAVLGRLGGTEASHAHRVKALELADKLPPARARGVRGMMTLFAGPAEHKESLRLLRQSYADAPDDAEIAGLYAAVAVALAHEEGFAVVDRLYARFPTRSIVPLTNAVGAPRDRDLDRDRRFIERLVATLPEARAWSVSVRVLVYGGKIAEAREAVAFGARLGLSGEAADASNIAVTRSFIELADLRPREAREIASALISDPRMQVSTIGVIRTIASYREEGRLADAEYATAREIERQRSGGSGAVAAMHAMTDLRHRRWLGGKPPSAEILLETEKTVTSSAKELGIGAVARLRSELALLERGAKARAAVAAAIAEIDALADREAQDDRVLHDSIRITAIPLLRELKGPADAAKRWRETGKAAFLARRGMAFEAALALDAAGDRAEAEKAYLLATDPQEIEWHGFVAVAAHARLADLYRALGRDADADRHQAIVTRVWAGADAGLLERVRKL